jgi:nicotinamide mononucleotide adenylyltransferase
MSRKSRTTVSAVEKLLEQRRLIQDWLAKLETDAEAMPAHVVERVRNDYRARLNEVLAELAEHTDTIRQGLGEAQSRHDMLEEQQKARRDELAEARLRKQVGEFDEGRFKEINARLKAGVDELTRELAASLRDIERYEEILELIEEPRAAAEPGRESEAAAAQAGEEAAEAEPAPEAEEEEEEEAEELEEGGLEAPGEEEPAAPEVPAASAAAPAAPAAAAAEAPAPRPESAPKKGGGLDELAFLRAVVNGGQGKRSEGAGTAGAPPASERDGELKLVVERADAGAEPAAPPLRSRASVKSDADPRRRSEETRRAAAEGKALVCKECGAPNLPTEWYCEKCGAELTAF